MVRNYSGKTLLNNSMIGGISPIVLELWMENIMIKPPPNSRSYYFNYKHSFSIVLLAVIDADYKFIYIDVGCNGRVADGGVFKNSNKLPSVWGGGQLPHLARNVTFVHNVHMYTALSGMFFFIPRF